MTITVFIFFIIAAFGFYQLAAIIINTKEIRRLRDIRYRNETQRDFGIARQELMMLTAEREISSRSTTFLFFYIMNTNVMRHPDKYRALSRMLHNSLLEDNAHDSTTNLTNELLAKESQKWSCGVKEVVQRNIIAINSLMVFHSPLLRNIVMLARIALPVIKKKVSKELGLFNYTSKILAMNNPEMRTFLDTKDELKNLAGFV